MLDILIVTVINWIMKTTMGQVVYATEAIHISLVISTCFAVIFKWRPCSYSQLARVIYSSLIQGR